VEVFGDFQIEVKAEGHVPLEAPGDGLGENMKLGRDLKRTF
jgi:hypothetical protein